MNTFNLVQFAVVCLALACILLAYVAWQLNNKTKALETHIETLNGELIFVAEKTCEISDAIDNRLAMIETEIEKDKSDGK